MTQYVNNSGTDLYVRSEDGPDVEVKVGETVDLPEADYGSSLVPVESSTSKAASAPTPAPTPPKPPSTPEPPADAPAPAEPTQEKAQ